MNEIRNAIELIENASQKLRLLSFRRFWQVGLLKESTLENLN